MSTQFPTSTPHLQSTPQTTQNALQILNAHHEEDTFSTGSPSLDSLFTSKSHATHTKPGLRPASVLELYGPPGVGKTRTLLGIVVQARLAGLREREPEHGKGQVLVVDCQGSLSPGLIHSTFLMYAAHHHLSRREALHASQGVHHRRILDQSHLTAFLHTLPSWIASHPEVNLVVIDNLSEFMRQMFLDSPTRALLHGLVKSSFAHITKQMQTTVVVTNQAATKNVNRDGTPATFGSEQSEGLLVSPLADTLGSQTWRIALYFDSQGERLAHLVSSPFAPIATDAEFAIDALGPMDRLDSS